jgi:DUF1680 family protein
LYGIDHLLRYCQAHEPIVEMKSVEGHAVRAMYLFTAVADLIRIDGAGSLNYKSTLELLWNNMTEKKMYLTGGIGAHKQWEGFGIGECRFLTFMRG